MSSSDESEPEITFIDDDNEDLDDVERLLQQTPRFIANQGQHLHSPFKWNCLLQPNDEKPFKIYRAPAAGTRTHRYVTLQSVVDDMYKDINSGQLQARGYDIHGTTDRYPLSYMDFCPIQTRALGTLLVK